MTCARARACVCVCVRNHMQVDDDLSEPDVTFTVEITSAENATVAQKSVPVTIIDDGGWPFLQGYKLCMGHHALAMRSYVLYVSMYT